MVRPISETWAAGGTDTLNVLVVGVGRMGSQIGCEYALAGYNVAFVSPRPALARRRTEAAIALAQRIGVLDGDAAELKSRMAFGTRLEGDFDLVVESIPEDFELKLEVLRPIAATQPDAIIATNTSSLSITAIGRAIDAPARTLGTHYWDPPLLMPLVEVVAGEATSATVLERMTDILDGIGKRAMNVEHEAPGFVWNRLQAVLMREALWIVQNGVASSETVDEIMRDGLARRWRYVGPFETAGLGGVETWRRIGENVLPSVSNATAFDDLDRWLPDWNDEDAEAARNRRNEALILELDGNKRPSPVPGGDLT